MNNIAFIPGPAGEQNENELRHIKPIYSGLRETKRQGGTFQPSLSDSNRTGLVCNVSVEVLKAIPGIHGETCLLLKDHAGTIQACMTKGATLKHGSPKPGDTLVIQKVC